MKTFLVILGTWVTLMTAIYDMFAWNPYIAVISFGCALVAGKVFHAIKRQESRETSTPKPLSLPEWMLVIITVACDVYLISYAITVSTGTSVASPWLLYRPSECIVFACATWTLLALARSRMSDTALLAVSTLHHFTAWSVVAIVIKHGFGFDPFIHRASVKEILAHGVILPKQPYYVGQYVLEASLAWIGIPLVTIDKWLVPILASILIPWAARKGLSEGWNLNQEEARMWMNATLLVPMMPFVFTVPHNLDVVLWTLVIFLFPALIKNRVGKITLGAIAMLALSQHPLLGVPVALLVTLAAVNTHPLIHMVAQAIAVPTMLALNQIRLGAPAFTYTNPFKRLDVFLGLFRDPNPITEPISWFWTILYDEKLALPAVAITVAVLGYWSLRTMRSAQQLAATGIGMLVSILWVSTLFTIPGIVWYEQSEFALRLLQALGISLLPLTVIGITMIEKRLHAPIVTIAIATLMMTSSWYFTYPTMDPKSHEASASVSDGDYEATALVEQQAKGPHVVVADQMTAVAALDMLGFERARGGATPTYPLPADENLSNIFLESMWNAPSRDLMIQAMDIAHVDEAFLLVPMWYPSANFVVTAAKPDADRIETTSDGAITLVEYRRR